MNILNHHGSELFNYDQKACASQILLDGDQAYTRVEYDEYVAYRRPPSKPDEDSESQPRKDLRGGRSITHRFSQDDTSGATMFDLAFRHGFKVDRAGEFRVPEEGEDSLEDLQGRVRRVICFRRKSPFDGAPDLLSLSPMDLEDLNIHPATLQYATRTTTESRFWSRDRSMLSLILSFSDTPKTPCDFLSMTYNVHTRSANILIRQSWEPRRHRLDDLDEYDHRLESSRNHWAHPLVMPVILLQVQFLRSEEAVAENTMDVVALEEEVSSNLGPSQATEPVNMTLRTRLTGSKDESVKHWGPMNMTNLMKKAHEVLRGTIKLVDTIRWMERAVKLLMIAGDELSERLDGSTMPPLARDLNMGGDQFGSYEREASPQPFLAVPGQGRTRRTRAGSFSVAEELDTHWHEIRQYLEALLRLSTSLETERRMAEARCRAQIDIVYSRMAQEDNALNARMAVTSSRDSASMKALAVITAIFLPGEFIGTLFGMSMFDWLAPSNGEEGAAKAGAVAAGKEEEPDEILSHQFWIYWIISIPLTVFILFVWRAWWVNQDRYFRRHLSQELSEERYWTEDGKPRELEHSAIYDFFLLSSRRDEFRVNVPKKADDERQTTLNGVNKEWGEPLARTQTRASNINTRQRQILNARQQSLQKRSIAIAV